MGDSTLVDLWIEGKFRAITISRQAIEAFLPPDKVAALSENDRREFVRTHLAIVVRAATERLRANPLADSISIDQLSGEVRASSPERRAGGDRRKGERRKLNIGPPGGIERRR
jgi:hypothetical protein